MKRFGFGRTLLRDSALNCGVLLLNQNQRHYGHKKHYQAGPRDRAHHRGRHLARPRTERDGQQVYPVTICTMDKLIETMGKLSPLGPLENVFIAIGEELGDFLDKSIDRIFETIKKEDKR